MTVAPNDLFRVAAVGEAFNQRIILTHAYAVQTVSGAPSEATVSGFLLDQLRAGGGGDLFETLYLACLPPQYTLLYWQVQKVAPTRFRYYKFTRTQAGTHAAAARTANQAAVITFGTLLGGRSQVSNKHIGPIPEGVNVQVDGLVASAYKDKLSPLASGMLQSVGTFGDPANLVPCIPHRTPAGSYTLMFNNIVQSTIRVQRRRTVGLGE